MLFVFASIRLQFSIIAGCSTLRAHCPEGIGTVLMLLSIIVIKTCKRQAKDEMYSLLPNLLAVASVFCHDDFGRNHHDK